jgi:Fe-S-cluster containining protein
MAFGDMSEADDVAAGDFSSWVVGMQETIRSGRGSDVPCDGCTACCTSSQFIHIDPDETDTLSRIPEKLLFPAPRLPHGHVLLGYDERGHCPMLVDNQCSIYDHRPRTCRTYDCRIFPAAGLDVDDDDDKALIARQARRWRFTYSTRSDRERHDAVRAAATFLDEHSDLLPDGGAPTTVTRLALLAIDTYDVFLRYDEETDRTTVVDPDPVVVQVEVMRRRGPGDAT